MGFPTRELPDGRWAVVIPLTFGRGRVVVQPKEHAKIYDDGW